MPISTRSRLGVTSVVTDLVDLLDQVNLLLPLRTSTAITRWKTLSTALRDYQVPPVGPARATAIAALVEAAGSDSVDVDAVINKAKVIEEQHRNERCGIYRGLLADAVNLSCSDVVSSVNSDEGQIVIAAQGRYAELVRVLIDAAVVLPEGFGERDALYAGDQLREPWVTATRTWESITRLRELVSTFDTFADLDPDWSKAQWTRSARVAEATLFLEQRCEFGEVGSIEFGLNLARACADNPAELWLPTARQASDLARQLWAGGIASYKLAAS
jgi:hypothetical protein